MVSLPVEAPHRTGHLVDEGVAYDIGDVVRQVPVGESLMVSVAAGALKQLAHEYAGSHVVEIVRPEPLGARLVLLSTRLEHRPEVRPLVDQLGEKHVREDLADHPECVGKLAERVPDDVRRTCGRI